MSAAYFWPLVNQPIVISGPGSYITRAGETVDVVRTTMDHEFGCVGTYSNGALENWHRSGRLFANAQSENDIVTAVRKTYRLYGMDFAIVAEYPDTEQGTAQANAFMEANRSTGLLAVEGGRIILAALGDKGANP